MWTHPQRTVRGVYKNWGQLDTHEVLLVSFKATYSTGMVKVKLHTQAECFKDDSKLNLSIAIKIKKTSTDYFCCKSDFTEQRPTNIS